MDDPKKVPQRGREETVEQRRKRLSDDLMEALILDADREEEAHYAREMGVD